MRTAVRALMRAVLLLCLALLGHASPVDAQRASALLPAEHWTRTVLVRMHALHGAGADPSAWLHTDVEAWSALRGWYAARLAAERNAALDTGRVYVETSILFIGQRDAMRPAGYTLQRDWTGPRPVRDIASGAVRLRAASVPHHRIAVATELLAAARSAVVQHATVAAAIGPFDLWAGRRAVGYRPGAAGGLVLDGIERFDGIGVRLTRRVDVPLLGLLAGETFTGPLARNGHVASPWLVGMRVHTRLHPRLDAGATRAAVFGALDRSSVGVSELAQVIVGANLGGDYADDQVASLDARWRPPLHLPIEIYGEWAMHDIDFGVLIDVPAFTIGGRLPRWMHTQRSELGLGLEHTQISGSCCGNPPWYHHFELADGWSTDGRLLGHPIGGHGREWRLTVTGAGASGAVLLDGAVALRTRGAENLFAPVREGRAVLYDIAAGFHFGDRLDSNLRLTVERGSDWSDVRGAAAIRWWW